MAREKRVAILIPSEIGVAEEFIESGFHRKIVNEGFVTLIPNAEFSSGGNGGLRDEIVQILDSQAENSVLLFGSSGAAPLVLNLLISGHRSISASVVVSPPFSDDLLYLLSRIEKPLLIVNGSDDSEAYLGAGRKYHDLIEESVHRVIKKAGHLPHLEDAQRFFLTLNKFLLDEL